MKVDMSPKAIENRLRLVGELTRACILLRQNSLKRPDNSEHRIRLNPKDKNQIKSSKD
jgi:hypothetical protein